MKEIQNTILSNILPSHLSVYQMVIFTIIAVIVSIWANNIADK
jgi:hypothetical protein